MSFKWKIVNSIKVVLLMPYFFLCNFYILFFFRYFLIKIFSFCKYTIKKRRTIVRILYLWKKINFLSILILFFFSFIFTRINFFFSHCFIYPGEHRTVLVIETRKFPRNKSQHPNQKLSESF